MPDPESMIERAARAVAAIDYRKGIRDCAHPSEKPVYTPIPWDDLPAKAQIESFEKCKAVLRAIREPSEGMVRAGNRSRPYNLVGYCEGTIHPVVQRAWPAMIDAALEEG